MTGRTMMMKPVEHRNAGRLALACAALVALCTGASAVDVKEPPFLLKQVQSHSLPPVAERLPKDVAIVDLEASGKQSGRYGGTLRTLIGKAKDTRRLVVYGYARLVGYDEKLEFTADILKDFTVEEGRIFTFYLREGHRWSDGHPFTSEDFRYYWHDVQTNKELAPGGITRELLVDGEPPEVEILDELTVRYSWSKPHPTFLQSLAAPSPLYIYRPSHYLKQFHASYTDREKLAAMADEAGKRNWVAVHFTHDRPYKNNDPTRPVLQPWVLITEPPSDRFVFHRNPFYHRIDANGHQLPYIDRVTMTVAGSKLIPAKVGSGESDLQSDYVSFSNYTFLKRGEKRNNYSVRRWVPGKGAKIALFPNLNTKDPQWRTLFRNRDFRHALSISINREDINKAIFYGLGMVGNNTVMPESALSKPEYRSMWAEYDPDKANRMLDDLGLKKRNLEGIRLLPDGEPMLIIVETAGESSEQTDVLQLIGDDWRKIGVRLFIKSTQREVFRKRALAGSTQIAVWSGLDNAVPTADWTPVELVPTDKNEPQWPQWGQYYETNGKSGEKPDMDSVVRLLELYKDWKRASTRQQRWAAWEEMLDIHAREQFSIGIVAAVPQVVIVSNRLRNVPEKALYNWEPGSYFGVYRPETFWFADTEKKTAGSETTN